MMKFAENTDWKNLYELINDIIGQDDSDSMLTCLFAEIDGVVPADRGVSLIKMTSPWPLAVRWPGYADSLIERFNSHFNRDLPPVYDNSGQNMPPVNWKSWGNSEYDREFNRPLRIGFTMGSAFATRDAERHTLVCLHRSMAGPPFSEGDFRALKTLTPTFAKLYNLRRSTEMLKEQQLRLRELCPHCDILSKREVQIAGLLCRHMTQREIGQMLGISTRTVETHALHIYQKLDVSGRKELIRNITLKSA